MALRKRGLLPVNRVVRSTLYRLLLAAPALPLTACGPTDDCGGPDPRIINTVDRNPDGTTSCARCPLSSEKTSAIGCGAILDDGTMKTQCYYFSCSNDGRRPEGLRETPVHAPGCELGALYAHIAWLEAASVPAFHRLAGELLAHGAPEALVNAARRSAEDEVRHTHVMQALARRHGASMPEVELAPFQPRSLEAMCAENAVEGCVRETFGALVTGWQARTAGDAEVRRALGSISRDELRHAELAWAVDAWAAERLAPLERERILQLRRETLRALQQEVGRQPPPEHFMREAGVPSCEQALSLLQGLAVLVA